MTNQKVTKLYENVLGFLKKLWGNEKVKWGISKIPLAMCIIFAVLSLAQVLYYTIGPAEGYFHADCTDSIYWAQAAVDSGTVFNTDFYYAALLPFSAQVWLVPLIHIFGVTMTAHVIGMVIFALLFFASMIFLCRSMEWGWEMSLFAPAVMMLMLSSSDKMREIMWGHVIYYSLGLLILFTGLGIFFRMCRHFKNGNKIRAWIYAAILFVFMMFAATNGVQCLAIYTLPMLAAIFAEAFFNSKEKLISRHNLHYWFGAAILCVATLVGMAILSAWKGDIIAGYAEAYSMLDDISNWVDNFHKFPQSYFSLFGINIADGADPETKETIFNVIKLAASVITLVLPVLLLVCYKKIEDRATRIITWVHFAVSAVIMIGFICGRLSAGNWRLMPMVGTGIFASVAAIRFMFSVKENAWSWRRVAVILAIFPVLCSFVNYKEIDAMPFDYGQDNAYHQIADFLKENDLEYGYAEFWTAQATTLIADSEVKVRCVTISRKDGIDPYLYQSNKHWFEDQEGVDKYFVVLSVYEHSLITNNAEWQALNNNHGVEQHDVAGYKIFVFDSNIWVTE